MDMTQEIKKARSPAQRNAAIFDLDGCLSDDSWRLIMIKDSGDDRFGEYHANLHRDNPLAAGSDRLNHHINAGDFIFFITARPVSVADETVKWIRSMYQIDLSNMMVFMRRADEEGVSAVTIKRDRITHIMERQTHMRIIAAYDDRPDIIQMYQSEFNINAWICDKDGIRNPAEGEKTVLGYHEERLEQLEKTWFVDSPNPPKLGLLNDPQTAADILEQAGATFRERNAVYKDNADNVGKVMAALFPNGVQLKTAADHKMYHLFELLIVKLTRFANADLKHLDSIHDAAVYAAMCQNLAPTHNIQFNNLEG